MNVDDLSLPQGQAYAEHKTWVGGNESTATLPVKVFRATFTENSYYREGGKRLRLSMSRVNQISVPAALPGLCSVIRGCNWAVLVFMLRVLKHNTQRNCGYGVDAVVMMRWMLIPVARGER